MCDICAGGGLGRRAALAGGAAFAAGLSSGGAARAAPERAATTPDAALALLAKGNARYVANAPHNRDFLAGRAQRAKGQAPFAAILGCSDSRVAPELTFDQMPGALFVVRVAGNFMTPEGLASLEFGAKVLGTLAIMVLGHSACGAVKATIAAAQAGGHDLPGHIGELVAGMLPGIEPVVREGGPDLEARAVIANVRYTVERLRTATPILSALIDNGTLKVAGGVYDLGSGKVAAV